MKLWNQLRHSALNQYHICTGMENNQASKKEQKRKANRPASVLKTNSFRAINRGSVLKSF